MFLSPVIHKYQPLKIRSFSGWYSFLLLFAINCKAAVTTNQSTSPTGVTNIVKHILTNSVVEVGNTNQKATTRLIIESGLSNNIVFQNGNLVEIRIIGLKGNGLPTEYGEISYEIKNPTNASGVFRLSTEVAGSLLNLLTLTTNKSVKLEKDAVGVLVDSSDVDFDLGGSYPLVLEPGHLVFTNLSANRFVVLPNATNELGARYSIKNISAANSLILTNYFGQTFDGATSYKLTNQWQSATIYSDGTNWLFESKIP